ncbi:MAG TPA: hypothetical protein PLR06_07180, partial [Cyclobacteriaceae bacterium]|nr:hypothetical protein [Cyclobacteriaceae bacterium]
QRIMLNDTVRVYVIGVVKDVYLKALFQPLAPVAFRYIPGENYRYLLASTDPERLADVNGQIKLEWKKLFPAVLYTGRLMEQDMVMALEHFDAVVILYSFLGLVAIIMSVSGLYSLVSLNLQRRTKELGIRKIMGAPLIHMLTQASKLFLTILAIAFIFGSFIGSLMVNALMRSVWEYYEAVDVRVLGLAMLILFLIAVTTIAYKIKGIVIANPVDSLRHE